MPLTDGVLARDKMIYTWRLMWLSFVTTSAHRPREQGVGLSGVSVSILFRQLLTSDEVYTYPYIRFFMQTLFI